MGCNSTYKLYINSLILLFLFAMPTPALSFDMEKGLSESTRVVYMEAFEFFEKENYGKSTEIIETYLKNGGENHGLLELLLGNISLKNRDDKSAFIHYLRSAELFTFSSDMWVSAGEIAYRLGNYKSADRCFERSDKVSPLNDNNLRFWGNIKFKIKKYDEFPPIAMRLKKKQDADYKRLLYAYAQTKRFKKARKLLQDLSGKEDWGKWWLLYGSYCMSVDEKESAAALRVYLKSGYPGEKRLHVASLFAKLKIYDEAYKIFKSVPDEEKECAYLIKQGISGYRAGEIKGAEDILNFAITRKCDHKPVMMLGHIYMKDKRYLKAAEVYTNYDYGYKSKYMAALSYAKGGKPDKARSMISELKKENKINNKILKLEEFINVRYPKK